MELQRKENRSENIKPATCAKPKVLGLIHLLCVVSFEFVLLLLVNNERRGLPHVEEPTFSFPIPSL